MAQPPETRRILGVDPGTQVTGYAFVEQRGRQSALLAVGVVRLAGREMEPAAKLAEVHNALERLIVELRPTELAIEAPFSGKNPQSMLKLGRMQGVVMALAFRYGLTVTEYPPTRVKQAVAGRGQATKEQVAAILPHFLPELRAQTLLPTDATDAVAIALCHLFTSGSPTASLPKSASANTTHQSAPRRSWKDVAAAQGKLPD
jgi:crossover junction endodeoxyribonuclease RuvC